MAATPEELARITNLESQFAAFQAGTIAVDLMTGTQRKIFENSLYPILNGYRNRKGANNFDYTAWEIGDSIVEINESGKVQVVGMVIAVPFNPSTDLTDDTKFDLYKHDNP